MSAAPARLRAPAALDPAGPFAAPLADLSWVLIWGGFAVLLIVLAALGLALAGPARARRALSGRPWLIGAGLAFPLITVTILLLVSLRLTGRVLEAPQPDDLRIRVIGEMWWWRVLYLEGDDIVFETANEIVIPAGRVVALELQSADVIHAFWIPRLGGKMDLVPGRTNHLRIAADAPGVFRGQCAEYCGASHALMALEAYAVPPAAFEDWAAAQAMDANTDARDAGQAAFRDHGCGACHGVRGTDANGTLGPDLTHFASRRMMAGGVLPNDRATLAAFLRDPAALKPAIRMPSYARLPDEEAASLLDYLGALR